MRPGCPDQRGIERVQSQTKDAGFHTKGDQCNRKLLKMKLAIKLTRELMSSHLAIAKVRRAVWSLK